MKYVILTRKEVGKKQQLIDEGCYFDPELLT